jgi:hypothetical protein
MFVFCFAVGRFVPSIAGFARIDSELLHKSPKLRGSLHQPPVSFHPIRGAV